MLITRISQHSNIERTLDIPCTQEQYAAWENGMVIQKAMPNISEEHREFIITGMTKEEWDNLFPEEDDYEHDYFESKEPF